MPSLDDFELPEVEAYAPPAGRRRKASAASLELSERVDALLAAGVLHPDRPLASTAAPRRVSRSVARAKVTAEVRAETAVPSVAPPPPRRSQPASERPNTTQKRTLRQQLAAANYQTRYWCGRAKQLERALVRAGVPLPPPSKRASND